MTTFSETALPYFDREAEEETYTTGEESEKSGHQGADWSEERSGPM